MSVVSIIGAGGHSKSSINLLKQNYNSSELYIFDDTFNIEAEELIHDVKVSGKICDIEKYSVIFLSIGDNKIRKKYFFEFKNQVIKDNLFHNSSIIENGLTIGISNQIFANVYINSFVEIGYNNIINTAVILEHEVKIGNHNHLSIGVKLCGRVAIGNNCMVGAGTIIIDKVSICDDVILGAGSVVIRNITESGTYVGNPARKIK